jgi:O-antigen ligase
LVLLWAKPARLPELAPLAWMLAALLSAEIGLLQYFGVASAFEPWVNVTALGEAFGNLRQRNQFATLTNIGLASLLWWVAQARSRPMPPGVLVFLAALLAVGNAASSSRTGLLQLILLAALILIWGGWRQSGPRWVALTALLAYGAAVLLLPLLGGLDPRGAGILGRLHEGDPTCISRLTLWSNVLHLIAQKPWLGWGWGELDYAHFITLYPGARFCDILDNAHNLPLHLAVELGLPLALLVCGGAGWAIWRARPWREQDATRQLAWTVLALILLHSMLEYPLWYGPFQVAAGLSLWLLWRSGSRSGLQLPAYLAPLTALLLLGASGYAAWDYLRISQIYLSPQQRSKPYREDTLAKIGDSWLFANQVRFAQLTTTVLTPDNARAVHDQAAALLHFSPEPRVLEMLIESAALLARDDEVRFYQLRYRAAFPESYTNWRDKKAAAGETHYQFQ